MRWAIFSFGTRYKLRGLGSWTQYLAINISGHAQVLFASKSNPMRGKDGIRKSGRKVGSKKMQWRLRSSFSRSYPFRRLLLNKELMSIGCVGRSSSLYLVFV